MSGIYQVLSNLLLQCTTLFWAFIRTVYKMENNNNNNIIIPASPNSNVLNDGSDGGGGFSPRPVNYDVPNIEEVDPNNDQLIREGQANLDREINLNYPLVSASIDIDRLHGDYAQEDLVYQQKVEDLKTNYSSLRKTRPDGNCFYRAFIFGYFESLFGDTTEQKRFEEICKITRKGIADVLGFPDFTIDEFYEYFSDITQGILQGRITTSEQLLSELDQPAVYDNIVVYLRLLTSYYLQKESEFFTNFIEGSGPIGEFCKREVEPMYKESDHIHIIALSSVLEVTVRVMYMDRGAGGKVNEHDFTPLKAEGPPEEPRIHLLYRPGHYDVLYGRPAVPLGALSPIHQNGAPPPLSPGNISTPASPAPLVVPHSPAHSGFPEPDSSSSADQSAAVTTDEVSQSISPRSPGFPASPGEDEANSTQPDL